MPFPACVAVKVHLPAPVTVTVKSTGAVKPLIVQAPEALRLTGRPELALEATVKVRGSAIVRSGIVAKVIV